MQKGKIWVGVIVILTTLVTGCLEESDFEKQQKQSDKEISNYLKENNINTETSSFGIHYEKLVSEPNGEAPASGDVMYVKYVIVTLDGDTLESVQDEAVPFKFNWNSVLPQGMNYGIDILKTGEKARFYLPSYTSYNSYSPSDNSFRAYTNFIVEMELVATMDETDVQNAEIDTIEDYIASEGFEDVIPSSSGLYYKTLTPGEGESPKSYNQVKLHYKRSYLDGTVIQETEADKPLTVQMNTNQLVKGFEQGVLQMKKGEKALLIMPSNLAFGSSVQIMPSNLREELFEYGHITTNVKPYAPVMYEVELLEIK
ncbi:FKBP-type peptidyl-prolyl cis-trans isomerase [Reichenbachiella agariperforans]|uniref:Peptidyl-prolyl cis-trans isomerase n=1 Tax=Reichenbachiella agariperforans TaxID=156994 RepID=A0A1M6JC46_REIAG|nr:FKBP-type peptidyl-prolyl cis-trans isomerase [Reichenbachiella agariperforans]MBU2913139.1 FKBP-type peptidyl-prolyl cis-trans isomerase [Reichenbachiella agariperforans]SHJ44210.1 FKBP-type peptidyl-prolyl cis-trans isomerase [Reichenbachiella agariperforans]